MTREDPEATVYTPTKRPHQRKSRGFSVDEIRRAGLTVREARRMGLFVDKRRRSARPENIQRIKAHIKGVANSKPIEAGGDKTRREA